MGRTSPPHRAGAVAALLAAAALGAAACGGRPAIPADPAGAGLPVRSTDATLSPAAVNAAPTPSPAATPLAIPSGTPIVEAATPPPTSSPAAATPAAATPAAPKPAATPRATPLADLPGGSIRLVLTEPMTVDATMPANVECADGRSYSMFTWVQVDGESVEVAVEIPLYHGPDDYRALLRVYVTSPAGTQGGEIPGVPVTITSDTKGRADFSYGGTNGSVEGKVVWTCSP